MTIHLRPLRFVLPVWLAVLAIHAPAGDAAPSQLGFNRDVRPILSENCFRCHGPDKNQRKARLRLDVRETALEKGAFVPGKPDESELVKRIYNPNPDDVMPPLKSNKKLAAAQKKLLKQWIAEGAQYQPHWAYIRPVRPAVPEIRNPKSEILATPLRGEGGRSPIDAFILAELEKRNIQPAPEADKRTVLRRLSLDLIGLPPSPAEVEAFLKDASPRAYEKQVDRLLASPHFGERMAAPWLDVVRFADTVGYHGDQNQNIFPYRDYVINAFNHNKPFNQFTVEQLAGDLLPNPTLEQRVATGFNRLNMMTREGGAQAKEYLARYQADRVRTVAGAWLGSTMGCCECHDHKFDPFTTKDFYQMEAFFADLKQWGVYTDYGYTPNPDLKGWSNDHPFPPEIEVDSPYLRHRITRLHAQSREIEKSVATKLQDDAIQRGSFEQWCEASRAFLKDQPTGWAAPKPEVTFKLKAPNALPATNFAVQADATVTFCDQSKEGVKFTLPLAGAWLAAIRLEIVPQADGNPKTTREKKRQASAIALSATLKSKGDGPETKIAFYHAEADHKEERYASTRPILGVTDRWQISPEHDLQTAVWLLKKPVPVTEGDTLTVSLGDAAVASARISISPFAAEDLLNAGGGESLRKGLVKSALNRSRAERVLVNETYLLSTAWDPEAFAQVQKIFSDVRECRQGRGLTMISEARAPLTTRVLPRGNWQDESGEIVEPAPPHFLPQPKANGTNRLTRLDLARWLVSPDNPLTARTVMNRQWKEFFGRGLAPVVDDLGAQSEPPLHPELLDWLAVEFMDSGWDVKHIVKLMVMSATYRQTSNQRPELKDLDPNNRLLAAQNPRRLDAEFVRDNALSIAGLLHEDLGGPSAFPYQPPGYYVNIQFPDREYYPDKDERQYRRGVYSHWQRTFLQPMLANFDAPAREECTATRVVSNTPQQALTLLNDPTFVECARVLAGRLLALKSRSDEQRLDLAFQRALARPAKTAEKNSLLAFLAAQRGYAGTDADEPGKLIKVGLAPVPKNSDVGVLAAWTQVCRVILNLHETITRY
jgi:hypothetical protein